ncbi:sensor histidine kinase [Planococcus faecalis]|uniref:sensor histidine kinase n=1 Tax=Planococcus faecalis TaxID=1598147 RepID=UPI00210D6C1F|nr:ATP-binding protein [Planococcus faecalis]
MLGNLVTNAFEAVDYLPENERLVRLLFVDNGHEILIEVEDSGKGVDPLILSTLFKERISTKNGNDRGYGLVKVYGNVHDLQGEITMENGDFGGALFIISIPIGGNEDD